ncbi:hypothetical protein YC2023_069410 [Brassica napus]
MLISSASVNIVSSYRRDWKSVNRASLVPAKCQNKSGRCEENFKLIQVVWNLSLYKSKLHSSVLSQYNKRRKIHSQTLITYLRLQIGTRPDQNPAVSHAQSAPGPIGIPSQLPMTGAASNQPSKWTSELFDCMNDGENALITCFFPFITFGQIAEVIDEGASSKYICQRTWNMCINVAWINIDKRDCEIRESAF